MPSLSLYLVLLSSLRLACGSWVGFWSNLQWSDHIYGGLICASVGLFGFDWFSFLFLFFRMKAMMQLWVCDLVVCLVVGGCGSGWWWRWQWLLWLWWWLNGFCVYWVVVFFFFFGWWLVVEWVLWWLVAVFFFPSFWWWWLAVGVVMDLLGWEHLFIPTLLYERECLSLEKQISLSSLLLFSHKWHILERNL